MTNTNENCIFCKIIAGEIPTAKIWEDEEHFSFLDQYPMKEGHTLVLPKKHVDYLFDMNNEDYTNLLLKAKKIAGLLKSRIKCDRICVIVEGFEIPHTHIHLIPLSKGDELNPKNKKYVDGNELNKISKKITNGGKLTVKKP